jgi:hypothetical protein
MARKGNKNKKKQQKKKRSMKNYNKSEFQAVFCQTCLICPKKADFCYNSLYQHEPKQFIAETFNNLVDIHATYQAFGRSIKTMSVEQFQNTVCRSGICFNGDGYASADCENLKECFKSFKRQMGVENPAIMHEKDTSNLIAFNNQQPKRRYVAPARNKKKNKKKVRYVPVSYPTFFSRDNADFQAEIRRILYGDHDSEQDSDKELSSGSAGAADRSTED